MSSSSKTMKCGRITAVGKTEYAEVPIPEIKPGHVLVKVVAAGICHTDKMVINGYCQVFPRIPGHEIAGVAVEIGQGVSKFKVGDHVGAGWFGGQCGECDKCRENYWMECRSSKGLGCDLDGGFAEYCLVPQNALSIVPKEMDLHEASPLFCAGVTVFNSFRRQNIKVGSRVAVQGLGGLGHLAVQFCKKLGYHVTVLSSGSVKEQLAKDLGADDYFNTSNEDWTEKAQKLGGFKCILVTAPNASVIPNLINALGSDGKLVLLAAVDPFPLNSLQLLIGNKSVVGFSSGDSRDASDTVQFYHLNHVKTMYEKVPLEKAFESLDNISKAKFRYVISFD